MMEETASWPHRAHVERAVKAIGMGHAREFTYDVIEQAYPPVSMEGGFLGMFRAMSLAAGGNRPEPVMTSMDRFKTFLAREGYCISSDRPWDRAYTVSRKGEICRPCEGIGKRMVVDQDQEGYRLGASISPIATLTCSLVTCQACQGRGYVPAAGDPAARFGDHSASDAWIAAKHQQRGSPP